MPEEEGADDPGYQRKDHVGLAEMAAGESPWTLHLANHKRGDHPDEDEQREDIHEQRVPALGGEPRQGRTRALDYADHRDRDRRQEDDEAPEDRGVHQARHQPLQELALPYDDDSFSARPGRNVIESGCGPAHADEAVEQHST